MKYECARCHGDYMLPNGGKYVTSDEGLCRMCIAEGYSLAWCPRCKTMQPIHLHEMLCDKCQRPKVA